MHSSQDPARALVDRAAARRVDGPSRRDLIALSAAAALGMWWASSASAADGLTPPPAPTLTNADAAVPTDGATQFSGIPGSNINFQILNFALTLEYLEADLYRQALNLATGRALTTALDPNPAVYTRTAGGGGLTQRRTDVGFLYLLQFTYAEAAHRDFIKGALQAAGETQVQPNPTGYKFPQTPAANIAAILGAILPLEETGVRAYLGALNYFTDLNLAQTAGTIYSTEARHSGVISRTLAIDPGPRKMNGDIRVSAAQPSENTFEYFLKPLTVRTAAQQYLA